MLPKATAPGSRKRRFAKACDACRGTKLRCDGVRPTCARCRSRGLSCAYADVQKPPRRQRRAQQQQPVSQTPSRFGGDSDGHENSSIMMPSSPSAPRQPAAAVIESSGQGPNLVGSGADRNNDLGRGISGQFGSSPSVLQASPDATMSTAANYQASSQEGLMGRNTDTRYFGPSSSISLVPTTVHQSKPPQARTEQDPPRDALWSRWTHCAALSVFEKRIVTPLPPWSEAFCLVKEYFDHEHVSFPCFHPPVFMSLFGQQYSGTFTGSSAWWTALNAVLAIAQRRRVERGQCPPNGADLAWGYAANALSTVLDIQMRNTELISIQALLALAWYFTGTPNPQPSFMLTASAVRLAQSLGLHKGLCLPQQSPEEQATRRKVFWGAISLDQELCFRTGRSPAHDFRDTQVEPTWDSPDASSEVISTNSSSLNVGLAHSQLALIQNNVYFRLYSTQPSGAASSGVTDVVDLLNQELQGWCSSFSPAFDAERGVQTVEHPALMRLYYSYYNCVISVHRAHCREYWMPLHFAAPPVLSPSEMTSIQRCLQAARSIAHLTSLVPPEWASLCWDVVSINGTAAVIMAANILRQPQESLVRVDLASILGTVQQLSTLDLSCPGSYIGYIHKLCEDLYKMAQTAAQPANPIEASLRSEQMQPMESNNGRTLEGGLGRLEPITGSTFTVALDDRIVPDMNNLGGWWPYDSSPSCWPIWSLWDQDQLF